MRRFTSPAVNDASKTSATSIEAVTKLLNHFGPSSTSWFGSTVATVLPAPYSASTGPCPSTTSPPIVSTISTPTIPSAPNSRSPALRS